MSLKGRSGQLEGNCIVNAIKERNESKEIKKAQNEDFMKSTIQNIVQQVAPVKNEMFNFR